MLKESDDFNDYRTYRHNTIEYNVASWNGGYQEKYEKRPISMDLQADLSVTVDGKEAKLATTYRAVLFKFNDGKTSGIMLSKIQDVSISGDAVVVTYIENSSIKSVSVAPLEEAAVFFLVGGKPAEKEAVWNKVFEKALRESLVFLEAASRDTKYTLDENGGRKMEFWARALNNLGTAMYGYDENKWPIKYSARLVYVRYICRLILNITGYDPFEKIDGRDLPQEAWCLYGAGQIGYLPEDFEPSCMKWGEINKPYIATTMKDRIYDAMASIFYVKDSKQDSDEEDSDEEEGRGYNEYFLQKNKKGEFHVTTLNYVEASDEETKAVLEEYKQKVARLNEGFYY
jgi:hypothetical protein